MYPQLSAGVYVRPAEAGGGGESAAQAVVFGGGASPLMVACLRNALKVVQLLVTEYPAEHNAAGEGEGDDLIDGCSLLKVLIDCTLCRNVTCCHAAILPFCLNPL